MSEERLGIDPGGWYPADGLREVEANGERVLVLLPGAAVERTRDCLQIDYGGEEGIVILVTAEAIELRLPTVEWTMGAYGPALASRLWKRVEARDLRDEELRALIREALEARRSQFATCRYCGQRFPPEHRQADDVCHGCASRYLGVVY